MSLIYWGPRLVWLLIVRSWFEKHSTRPPSETALRWDITEMRGASWLKAYWTQRRLKRGQRWANSTASGLTMTGSMPAISLGSSKRPHLPRICQRFGVWGTSKTGLALPVAPSGERAAASWTTLQATSVTKPQRTRRRSAKPKSLNGLAKCLTALTSQVMWQPVWWGVP